MTFPNERGLHKKQADKPKGKETGEPLYKGTGKIIYSKRQPLPRQKKRKERSFHGKQERAAGRKEMCVK